MRRIPSLVVLVMLVATLHPAIAQQATPPAAPTLDFSGLAFGSFNMRTDSAAKASLGGKSPNQFSIDRIYLTFRMPAGDNALVRVTTDVFQNATNAYYGGWAIRLKYGYFQYTGLKDHFGTGSSLVGRVGALHNVVIDHEELFWPRYLNTVGLERTGYFSSADVGAAALMILPHKWGELYGTVVNGPGYTAAERDRFKDTALRATFTPLASHDAMSPMMKTFAISPWIYRGKIGSAFSAGGAGQVGPGTNGAITDGMARNRYGIFAGIRDRRLNAGVDFAQRTDGSETGLNTTLAPRVATDSTGRLIDGFIVARPMEWMDASKKSSLSIVARYDRLTPNTDPTSANYAGTTPSYSFMLIGGSYDVTQRITLTLDWQTSTPSGFPPPTGANVKPTPKSSTLFLHWLATF